MASVSSLVIPLTRASQLTTRNLEKSKHQPYSHAVDSDPGNNNLALVFERKAVDSAGSLSSTQTVLQVKNGSRAAYDRSGIAFELVSIVDLQQQAGIAAQIGNESSSEPIVFACLVRTSYQPSLSIRYQLRDLQFYRIQYTFRTAEDCIRASQMLESLGIPLKLWSAPQALARSSTVAPSRTSAETYNTAATTLSWCQPNGRYSRESVFAGPMGVSAVPPRQNYARQGPSLLESTILVESSQAKDLCPLERGQGHHMDILSGTSERPGSYIQPRGNVLQDPGMALSTVNSRVRSPIKTPQQSHVTNLPWPESIDLGSQAIRGSKLGGQDSSIQPMLPPANDQMMFRGGAVQSSEQPEDNKVSASQPARRLLANTIDTTAQRLQATQFGVIPSSAPQHDSSATKKRKLVALQEVNHNKINQTNGNLDDIRNALDENAGAIGKAAAVKKAARRKRAPRKIFGTRSTQTQNAVTSAGVQTRIIQTRSKSTQTSAVVISAASRHSNESPRHSRKLRDVPVGIAPVMLDLSLNVAPALCLHASPTMFKRTKKINPFIRRTCIATALPVRQNVKNLAPPVLEEDLDIDFASLNRKSTGLNKFRRRGQRVKDEAAL